MSDSHLTVKVTHKLTWVFLRGGRAKLNCSCGKQTRIFAFPEGKGNMIAQLKGQHRA